MRKNFLFELGVEELPTDSLDLIESQFKKEFQKKLEEARLPFEKISLETTPRRVTLFVTGLPLKQEDQEVEWTGPSWEKAYDQEGKPSQALLGFLRGKNLKETEIQKKETPRGVYVCASAVVKGKKINELLPEILSEIVKSLPFARNMRWDDTRFAFSRPIRWIVSLLDNTVLKIKIGHVTSNRYTYGHRFLAPKKISITKADEVLYKKTLKKAHVLLSLEERKELIRAQFQAKAGKSKCDEELLHTIAHLVEEPFMIAGKFSSDFLNLPQEILSTSMKKHQKIFAVYDAKGKLQPEFAAVLNGKRSNLARITKDYQGVLEAKLRDALFFYAEDSKEKLAVRAERLKDVVFLGKLGNLLEKTNRLVELADWAGKNLKFTDEDARHLKRAAFLCKADLLTQMVYEFPELQGIMGREYAKLNGEAPAVCSAISDHYLPKNLSQPHQELYNEQSKLGAFLAILDKMDTLAGAFGIGLEPSGSQDPYALRRTAGGIVKIIRAFNYRIPLEELAKEAIRLYGNKLTKPADAILSSLGHFLKERIVFELGVQTGSKEDQILRAVLKSSWSDIAGVFLRYGILRAVYNNNRAGFQKAHKVIERTHNILKGAGQSEAAINKELFQDPIEKKLYELIEEKAPQFEKLAFEEKFDSATSLYGDIFYDPLHQFFDQVLVNVEDHSVRQNRQALMKKINRLYVDRVADLSVVNAID